MSEIDYEKAREYGHYQTRAGNPARFVCLLEENQYPELWVIRTGGREVAGCRYRGGGESKAFACPSDIISVPKKHTVEVVYYRTRLCTIEVCSKSAWDNFRMPGCGTIIARRTETITEGEGL